MKQNMMKRMILSFALAMIAWVGYAQDIKGKWLTEAEAPTPKTYIIKTRSCVLAS